MSKNSTTYLSIVIPTYNRATRIKKTLIELAAQLNNFEYKDIELIVSDNNSNDDTGNTVKHIIDSQKNIKIIYNKNKSNIGFDANVCNGINLASGKFSWVLSDDDELMKYAISTIYTLLKKYDDNELNYAFINYQIEQSGKYTNSNCKSKSTHLIEGRHLFSEVLLSNTLISSNVFKTSKWRSINSKNYIGSQWVHVLLAREILKSGKALIIGEHLITMKQLSLDESRSEKRDASRNFDFYSSAHFNLCTFVKSLLEHGYDKTDVCKLKTFCTSGEYGHIINLKLTVKESEFSRCIVFGKMLINQNINNIHSLALKLILLSMPSFLYTAIKNIKKKMRAIQIN